MCDLQPEFENNILAKTYIKSKLYKVISLNICSNSGCKSHIYFYNISKNNIYIKSNAINSITLFPL